MHDYYAKGLSGNLPLINDVVLSIPKIQWWHSLYDIKLLSELNVFSEPRSLRIG